MPPVVRSRWCGPRVALLAIARGEVDRVVDADADRDRQRDQVEEVDLEARPARTPRSSRRTPASPHASVTSAVAAEAEHEEHGEDRAERARTPMIFGASRSIVSMMSATTSASPAIERARRQLERADLAREREPVVDVERVEPRARRASTMSLPRVPSFSMNGHASSDRHVGVARRARDPRAAAAVESRALSSSESVACSVRIVEQLRDLARARRASSACSAGSASSRLRTSLDPALLGRPRLRRRRAAWRRAGATCSRCSTAITT